MKNLSITIVGTLLCGCMSNGYKDFYKPLPGADPSRIAAMRVAPPPPVPKLDKAPPPAQDVVDAYARYGYAPIGSAFFSSGHDQSEKSALEEGAKVGADVVVILNPQFAGSQSMVIPMTTPTSQTSYTTGTATAYGPGGSATVNGNATTTTYGSQTSYIPITINRFDFGAIYFVKRKYTFGAIVRDLTDAERQHLQSNRGLLVTIVVNGTPAFDGDVLPGDILLAMNGQSFGDQASFGQETVAHAGQLVELTIDRNGQKITKTVKFSDYSTK